MESNAELLKKILAGAEALYVDGVIKNTTLSAYLWSIIHAAVRDSKPSGIIYQTALCCVEACNILQSRLETK